MSSDKNKTGESSEEEIEIVGLEPGKDSKKKRAKYLENPNKIKTGFLGVVLAFIFSAVFSLIFNISKVVEKGETVKNLPDLFIMDKCLVNIFTFFLMGLFILVPAAFILVLKWKKKAWISLIVFGVLLFFIQYKMVPYLQRLIVGRKIYNDTKQVVPFIKSRWDHLNFSKLLRTIDTELKVSIMVFKNKIVGISNVDGSQQWAIDIPEEVAQHISSSMYIFGSNFYYSTKKIIFSRKIMNGGIDWSHRVQTNSTSNFSADKEVFSFYCRNCKFPKTNRSENKNEFVAHIVFLNNHNGKLISALPVAEDKIYRALKAPLLQYIKPQVFIAFEKTARIIVADDTSINYDGPIATFFEPSDIKEALGLSKKERVQFNEPHQQVYFIKDKLLFNSNKWLRLFDLNAKKQEWELSKGFLSSGEGLEDKLFATPYSSLLILVEQGNSYAVSFKTGKIIWGPKAGGYKDKPAIMGNTVFVNSSEHDGSIYALKASRGIYLYKWSQHKKIRDLFSWDKYIFFNANDNLGLRRSFGFEYK